MMAKKRKANASPKNPWVVEPDPDAICRELFCIGGALDGQKVTKPITCLRFTYREGAYTKQSFSGAGEHVVEFWVKGYGFKMAAWNPKTLARAAELFVEAAVLQDEYLTTGHE